MTRSLSLFAALSILVAVLVAFVSPIVDVDCGTDQSPFVADSGEVVDSFAKENRRLHLLNMVSHPLGHLSIRGFC